MKDKNGNNCMPKNPVVDEKIYQSTYPSREELANLAGIATSPEMTEPACCPSCNCSNTPKKSGLSKIIKYGIGISALTIALAIVFIQVFKPKQTTVTCLPTANYGTANQSNVIKQPEPATPSVVEPKLVEPSVQPTVEPAQVTQPPVQQIEVKKNLVGEYLVSYNDLNKVAMDKDTVFIYICADETAQIPPEIEKAIQDAEKTLKGNGIKVGIYTLSTSAPEYSGIASQGTLPTIFVSTKGKGSTFVKGTINGDNLLQAYTLTTKTAAQGGCCPTTPGGCG